MMNHKSKHKKPDVDSHLLMQAISAVNEGKSISTSTPSFSIRYNAEEEEVEQLYEPPKLGKSVSEPSIPSLSARTPQEESNLQRLSRLYVPSDVNYLTSSEPNLAQEFGSDEGFWSTLMSCFYLLAVRLGGLVYLCMVAAYGLIVEAHSDNSSPQTTPVVEKKTKEKSARRSGSFEDGNDKEDKWRLFTEFKGRITKKVEEKLDEIKTERMIKDKLKKEKKEKLKTTNSLSDSEDRSEDTSLAQASTVSNASSSPEKTKSLTVPNNDESDLGDISGSEEGSTPERPSTPTFTDDLNLQRPRPAGSQSAIDDIKARGKKGLKFNFMKKKVPVEEGVEVFEEVPAVVKTLPVPKRKYRVVAHRPSWTWTAVGAVSALLIAYFFQRPTFLSGILVGVILSFITALWSSHLYRWMTVVDPETNFLHGHYNFENVPFLSDKVIKKDSTPPEHKYYKGWMNELPVDYIPQNYHISHTDSVYVKLVGSILRLCTPKVKIPKRASWNEPKHTLKFTRERAFDIARCEVQLLPENLSNKRKWSRKYPMVIYLLPTSHLGTRWAASRKNLSDSDHSYEPSRNSPVNEIYIGNKKRDHFKWKMENLLRKFAKEEPNCFGEVELEPVDSDIFHSDLEDDGLDQTPRDSPTPSVREPASRKSPAGSPTRTKKEVKPPPPDHEKESNSKSSKNSPENSPKRVVPAQEDDSSYADPPSVVVNDADDEGEDEEDDSISGFVKISPVTEKTQIILFARSAREKDLWFRRLVAATTYTGKSDLGDDKYSEKHAKRREKRMEELRDYVGFMKSYGQFRCSYEDDTGVVTYDHTNKERENYLWLNLFLARILYDPMRQDHWIELIKNKIQKKLAMIRVPAFIEPITLAEIKFSGSVPAIEWTHNVSMNDAGIWTEVEISYQGTMTMTVYTKLNAFTALAPNSQLPSQRAVERRSKTAYMDSSQEDSGETSTEELGERTAAAKTLAFIDKVGSSKIVQQLKETRFVKKAMEDVSNTPIHLNVRVNRLIGTLVLNIPPPPSDRLWYGFKPNVEIHMECKPIFGATNINVDYISNMIEKVLRSEFQKVIVMPNMDDLVIPLMSRDMPY